MLRDFTEVIDPIVLCERGRTISGVILLADLPRLNEFTSASETAVKFDIKFEKLARKKLRITGSVVTALAVKCQCCLEQMTINIDRDFELQLVTGLLEAEQLPEEIDPLLLDDDEDVSIASIIEDELLLDIPMAPMHTEGCNTPEDVGKKELPVYEEDKKENPFAALAAMQKKN